MRVTPKGTLLVRPRFARGRARRSTDASRMRAPVQLASVDLAALLPPASGRQRHQRQCAARQALGLGERREWRADAIHHDALRVARVAHEHAVAASEGEGHVHSNRPSAAGSSSAAG